MREKMKSSTGAATILIFSLATSSVFAQSGFRTGQYDGQANLQYDGRASHRDGIGPTDLASGVASGSFGVPGALGTPYRYNDAYIDNNAPAAIDPGNCGQVYRSYDRTSGRFLGYGDMRSGCR
jgi:hypothetical protein